MADARERKADDEKPREGERESARARKSERGGGRGTGAGGRRGSGRAGGDRCMWEGRSIQPQQNLIFQPKPSIASRS